MNQVVPGTFEKAGSEDVRAFGGKAIEIVNTEYSFEQSRCEGSSSTRWYISKGSTKGNFVGIGTSPYPSL